MARKTMHCRLFEAWTHGHGVILYASDVEELLADDAVATNITNAACNAAGIAEVGADEVQSAEGRETWKQFQERLKKGGAE